MHIRITNIFDLEKYDLGNWVAVSFHVPTTE